MSKIMPVSSVIMEAGLTLTLLPEQPIPVPASAMLVMASQEILLQTFAKDVPILSMDILAQEFAAPVHHFPPEVAHSVLNAVAQAATILLSPITCKAATESFSIGT
jgi:hypothetical protein